MKLVTFDTGDGARVGALTARGIVDLQQAGDMTAVLHGAGGDLSGLARAADAAQDAVALDRARLLAPVPRPGKIIGVGRNYGAHATEGGLEKQEEPRLFGKFPHSVIGPGDVIRRPAGIEKLDWEAELAVVVGRTMKDVPEERALDHVAGYTIVNDVSAREFQFDVSPPQTTIAKSLDTFTPMGPVLVTADEFGAPDAVDVRCWVNDVLMQEGNTHDMIFPVRYILAYISRFMTLEPGDVIATGTPSGVGHFRKPPLYLVPEDTVRVEVAGIGVLENPVG